MADTRVANAIYQLEVDEMILEYLLYHAIKSSLADGPAVSQDVSQHSRGSKLVEDAVGLRANVTRPLAIFDGRVSHIWPGWRCIETRPNTHSQIS